MGRKVCTVAVSPWAAAIMIRSFSRMNRSIGVIWLMSGRAPGAAAGAGAAAAATPPPAGVGALSPVTRQMIAATVRMMMAAAAIQGSRSGGTARSGAGLAGPVEGRTPPAAGVPQRWQNRAPGPSAAPQELQGRAARDAPQVLQNCPEAGTPQEGQGVPSVGGGWVAVITRKNSRVGPRPGARGCWRSGRSVASLYP